VSAFLSEDKEKYLNGGEDQQKTNWLRHLINRKRSGPGTLIRKKGGLHYHGDERDLALPQKYISKKKEEKHT